MWAVFVAVGGNVLSPFSLDPPLITPEFSSTRFLSLALLPTHINYPLSVLFSLSGPHLNHHSETRASVLSPPPPGGLCHVKTWVVSPASP